MTVLYWLAVLIFGGLTVRSDSDWRAIPYIFLFMAALSMAMVDLWPEALAITSERASTGGGWWV